MNTVDNNKCLRISIKPVDMFDFFRKFFTKILCFTDPSKNIYIFTTEIITLKYGFIFRNSITQLYTVLIDAISYDKEMVFSFAILISF